MDTILAIWIILFLIGIALAAILIPFDYLKEPTGYYNILIMGNQGQFEYFKRTYDEVNPLQLTKQEKIDRIFKDSTYNVSNGQCQINTPIKLLNLTDFNNLNNLDARNEGMKNFYEITQTNNFQILLKKAEGIVFLGNSVDAENKLLATQLNKRAYIGNLDQWIQRLQCGWNVFIAHLENMKLMKDGKVKDKVFNIAGNNAYDISYKNEDDIVRQLENSNKISTFWNWDSSKKKNALQDRSDNSPYEFVKKTTIWNKDRPITFIDFDSACLLCLGLVKNEEEYNNPNICSLDSNFMGRFSYKDITNYYLSIYDAVSNLDPTHWNVIRSYHSPTNYLEGDASFFWNVWIDGIRYNLMDKFEEKNVRIYLAASISVQSVMAVPFRKSRIRTKGDFSALESDGNYCNSFNLRDISEELLVSSASCPNESFEADLKRDKMMLVFNTGNSGKNLNYLGNGARSERGNIVWARKYKIKVDGVLKDAFGFSTADFLKDKLIFKFWELNVFTANAVLDSRNVALFNVHFNDMK